MKIIIGGRGSGKTFSLVELVKNDPHGLMVVRDEGLRQHLMNKYGLQPFEIVAADSDEEVLRQELNGNTLYLDCIDEYGEIDDIYAEEGWISHIAMLPTW